MPAVPCWGLAKGYLTPTWSLIHTLEPDLSCPLQSFAEVYPHLVTATDVPTLVKIADVDWDNMDAAFCCLPHATTQETLAQLPKHIKVVDLSADFRLRDVKQYAEW